jgi:hypothetical protein
MLNETKKAGWDAIDEAAVKAGGYLAIPKRPLVIEYDYRAMTKYCREKGISKMDLSEEELRLFEYSEPLIYA